MHLWFSILSAFIFVQFLLFLYGSNKVVLCFVCYLLLNLCFNRSKNIAPELIIVSYLLKTTKIKDNLFWNWFILNSIFSLYNECHFQFYLLSEIIMVPGRLAWLLTSVILRLCKARSGIFSEAETPLLWLRLAQVGGNPQSLTWSWILSLKCICWDFRD